MLAGDYAAPRPAAREGGGNHPPRPDRRAGDGSRKPQGTETERISENRHRRNTISDQHVINSPNQNLHISHVLANMEPVRNIGKAQANDPNAIELRRNIRHTSPIAVVGVQATGVISIGRQQHFMAMDPGLGEPRDKIERDDQKHDHRDDLERWRRPAIVEVGLKLLRLGIAAADAEPFQQMPVLALLTDHEIREAHRPVNQRKNSEGQDAQHKRHHRPPGTDARDRPAEGFA